MGAGVTNAQLKADIDEVVRGLAELRSTLAQTHVDEMVCRQQQVSVGKDVEALNKVVYGNGTEGIKTTVSVLSSELKKIHDEVVTLRNTNRVIMVGIVMLLIETVVRLIGK